MCKATRRSIGHNVAGIFSGEPQVIAAGKVDVPIPSGAREISTDGARQ